MHISRMELSAFWLPTVTMIEVEGEVDGGGGKERETRFLRVVRRGG